PAALDFGHTSVNGGVNQKTITISNLAAANEDLSYSISIPTSSDYSMTGAVNGVISGTLTHGTTQSIPIQVNFDPSAKGTRTATATITSNDADAADEATVSPVTVSLTGVGDDKEIGVAPGSLAFGTVTVGQSTASQGVAVSNNGVNSPL